VARFMCLFSYSLITKGFVAEIRYDTTDVFNVDWKAECGQLNLLHVTKNQKDKKKKLKQMPT